MKTYWDKRRENYQELELLPPKERFHCLDCKRKFSKLWKCKDGIERCKVCKKKLVTNKFYIPPEKRKKYLEKISKFNITRKEKDLLHKKFMDEGLSSEEAWNKVNFHIQLLKAEKRKKRWSDKARRRYFAIKNKERKEQKRKFIEGLR